MSNLANAAASYGGKRVSITLDANKGSRSRADEEVHLSARQRKTTGISIDVGQGSRSRAEEADRLSTPRRIKITGAVEGEGLFDGSSDITIYTDDLTNQDYEQIKNKPKINGVELIGNKTSDDLGIQPAGDYVEDPMTEADIDEIISQVYTALP